jgi:hypothetical protein
MHGAASGWSSAIECLTGCAHGYGQLYWGLSAGRNEHAGSECAMTNCGVDLTMSWDIPSLSSLLLSIWNQFSCINRQTHLLSTRLHTPSILIEHIHLYHTVMAMCPLQSSLARSATQRTGHSLQVLVARLASSTHLPLPSRTLPVSSWCIFRRPVVLNLVNNASSSCNRPAYQPSYPLLERIVQAFLHNPKITLLSCRPFGLMIPRNSTTRM